MGSVLLLIKCYLTPCQASDPAHPGGMAAISASEEKVARYISKLDVAVYDGPESYVVSGVMKAIKELVSGQSRWISGYEIGCGSRWVQYCC